MAPPTGLRGSSSEESPARQVGPVRWGPRGRALLGRCGGRFTPPPARPGSHSRFLQSRRASRPGTPAPARSRPRESLPSLPAAHCALGYPEDTGPWSGRSDPRGPPRTRPHRSVPLESGRPSRAPNRGAFTEPTGQAAASGRCLSPLPQAGGKPGRSRLPGLPDGLATCEPASWSCGCRSSWPAPRSCRCLRGAPRLCASPRSRARGAPSGAP